MSDGRKGVVGDSRVESEGRGKKGWVAGAVVDVAGEVVAVAVVAGEVVCAFEAAAQQSRMVDASRISRCREYAMRLFLAWSLGTTVLDGCVRGRELIPAMPSAALSNQGERVRWWVPGD